MEQLELHFENCYGIKKLKHSFDFTKSKVQIIYAPNGAMKSSFAKTFEDISLQKASVDRIFSDRVNHRSVQVDGRDIEADEIFVIHRMQEADFKEASTLLANEKLKTEFDSISSELNKKKIEFIKKIQPCFGVKENLVEGVIEQVFKVDLFTFIENKAKEISEINEPIYGNIIFNEIFNEKAHKFLSEKSFNTKIREYIEIYDRLVDEKSTFFKKGDFNHNNADNIAKSLKENGFFKANHQVKIKDQEIADIDALVNIIQSEKDKILNDPELTQKFNEIDKVLNANNELRKFRSYVENNKEIIKEFVDLENFKKKLILNYIAEQKSEFDVFVTLYVQTKTRRDEIVIAAKQEQSEWVDVLNIFKNRFTVPFDIKISNQEDVILNNQPASLIFTYIDGSSRKEFGKEINHSLSTGEQRVFYLLNIIFQIETKKKNDKDQLIIVDDIADSFDYKNKYAIIEYLKDIADNAKFKMILLTHNFDFYKTVKSRLEGVNNWLGNFKATKSEHEVRLEIGEKNDIFPLLRKNYNTCEKSFISCIPFVRNLIEYTKGKDGDDYLILTSLLHVKPSFTTETSTVIKPTKEHTVGDLLTIFNNIFSKNQTASNSTLDKTTKVYDLVLRIAENIISENEHTLDLTSKLCLSIAIRYKAEEYILDKLTNRTFLNSIQKKETGKIVGQYKLEFPNNTAEIEVLDRVNLMTAENIHVNSFMYEPLMDLSEDHLRRLYSDVSNINKLCSQISLS